MAKRKLSNSEKALADQKAELAGIRRLISDADAHEEGQRKSLNSALESLYALTVKLLDAGLVRSFIESEGASWGKVQEGNPFQPMVKVAFAKSSSSSSESKYAKVLHQARAERTKPADFLQWLANEGGLNVAYAKALQGGATLYDRQFEDTREERLSRALEVLKDRRIGKPLTLTEVVPEVLDVPENVAPYRNAIVRVHDGKVELVQVLSGRKEDVINSLLSSVPSDPPYARRRIVAKPLYDLFRACDLLVRFGADASSAEDLDQNDLLAGEGAIDLGAFAASVKAKSLKSKSAGLDRFRNQSGLLLHHDGQAWLATTISTLPTFVGVEVVLSSALETLDTAQRYFLSSHQAKRLVLGFPSVATWQVRVRKRLRSGEFDAAGDDEIVVDKLDRNVAWRSAEASRPAFRTFEVPKGALAGIGGWKVALQSESVKIGLPKQFAIKQDKRVIWAVFPEDAKLETVDRSRRRPIGHLSSDKSLPADTQKRWLLRADVLEIAQIATDYGVEFHGAFVGDNEGTAALRLEADSFKIVVPLAVSLAGDRAFTTSQLG